jgi:hypothetical protein
VKKAIGIAVCILILPFIVNIPDAKRVKFNIGDWQVTEVNGALVKAKPFNAVDDNPPKVNMKAVIHLFPGLVHAEEMPVVVPGSPSSGASGKVIMLRGQDVTIQLDKGQPEAAEGDIVELSFSAGGEVIPVGTWRVSVVKGGGIVEAKPLDPKGKPNIGMDAFIRVKSRKVIEESIKEKEYARDDVASGSTDERTRYEKACDNGDAEACTNFGYMYEAGKGVKQDYRRAADLYKKACDGGNALGCNSLGGMYVTCKGVKQDYRRAADLYKKACDGGNALGCANLGWMHDTGKGVAQDYPRAIELYKKACDGGNAAGCANLGWMYYQGRGSAPDRSRARSLLERACTMGNQWSCDKLKKFGK